MTPANPMSRALDLARRGEGRVEPNPMVGAVVLDASGQLAGEGWHQQFGGPHAEVFALQQAGERARGGTLFVTLEPCCHFGKTPPCADAVIRAGVRKVVAAMADPFPRVAGGGFGKLRDAGVEVEVGMMRAEAEGLNAPYLHRLRAGEPWLIAKWAMSLDGRIATRTGHSLWISSEASRAKVHKLRGRVDAVMVGGNTVRVDDPLLTARPAGPRTAARVVVTASGDLPAACRLRATAREVPVVVYTTVQGAERLAGWAADGAEVLPLALPEALADMGRRGWTNVLVEGGAGLLGSLADLGKIQEVWAFVAPVVLGGAGAPAPVGGAGAAAVGDGLSLRGAAVETVGGDVWVRGRVTGTAPGRAP